MSWWSRLTNTLHSRRLDDSLEDEIQDHLERRAAALREEGIAPDEARRRALAAFGSVTRIREESREIRLSAALDSTIQDVRYAWRTMRRSPAFTITAILSLGMAIGANTAIYAIVDAAMLRPLPVPDPARVFTLAAPALDAPTAIGPSETESFSYPIYGQLRAAAGGGAHLAAFGPIDAAEAQSADPASPIVRITQQFVSGNAFEMLRVPPDLGRLFSPEDDRVPGLPRHAVLSFDYWRRHYNRDPAVVGQSIILNGRPFQIVGVVSPEFFGVEPGRFVDVWVPLMTFDPGVFSNPDASLFRILGRLSDSTSPEQLQARLQVVYRGRQQEVIAQHSAMPAAVLTAFAARQLQVRPGGVGASAFQRSFARPMWIVWSVAAAMLLVACANVAGLLLSRSASRSAEMLLRTSLGASRGRLLRQLLTESVMLAGLASVLGLVFANLLAPWLVTRLSSESDPIRLALVVDVRVLLFCTAIGTATTLLVGLLPAWHASGPRASSALPPGRGGRQSLGLGRMFVSVQVAFVLCLVIAGAAFLLSLHKLFTADLGFEPRGVTVLTMRSDLGPKQDGLTLTRQLQRQVSMLPNVSGAAVAWVPIFGESRRAEQIVLEGQPPSERQETFYRISPAYFSTLETPLVQGRDFDLRDTDGVQPIPTIVNQAFARRYFGEDAVIGRQFARRTDNARHVIVGVAADAYYSDLRNGIQPVVYFPMKPPRFFTVYVRSSLDPGSVRRLVEQAARTVGPGLHVVDVTMLETLIGNTLLKEKLLAGVAGVFASLGLSLVAIGLFGLLSYSVVRRRKELALRAALGARPSALISLVLKELLGMMTAGLAAGLLASMGVMRLVQSQLFGMSAVDPVVIASASTVLLLTASIAVCTSGVSRRNDGPARRVTRGAVIPLSLVFCHRLVMAQRAPAAALALAILLTSSITSSAQDAQSGRLIITVVDASGAVVPGATVTVNALDDGARAAAFPPVTSSDRGVATVDRLLPGRYRIVATFPGFETGVLPEVRVRRGDNRHVVVLPLKKLEESVTVAQNAQAAAADPRGSAFKTVLTAQEIENLSDDPTEMAQQLQDLAGGNATIRVDSFAGAPLPPKALIKSIHIVRDQFAAENHSAESEGIDIITQPGQGAVSGGFTSRLRDGSLSARSPFVAEKGPERQGRLESNVGGTLVKGKSSFALSVEGRSGFDTPVVYVALPDGSTRSELLDLRHPSDDWSVYGLVDYALTPNQTLRLSYDYGRTSADNLGVGGFDLKERAYSTSSHDHEIRAQVVGPVGRRMFANSRVQFQAAASDAVSTTAARTVIVNGAFTSGGAQVSGGRRPRTYEAASDIDYVRGIHTVRFGFLAQGGWYESDNATNRLGTYTFSSIDAYNAGTPDTYTQRIGNPALSYFNAQTAVYVQDDLRVNKGLTLSPGVRYEVQTHLSDRNNIGPRMGLTWAPLKSGHTTIRGSFGMFYNWLSATTYEQTLRVDGFRQRDLFIINPTYPEPGPGGTISTTNRFVLGPDVQMGRVLRASAGIDQTISPKVRVNASFQSVRFADQLRGTNLNLPLNGVRPDPNFANIIETVSDAQQHSDQLATTLNLNFAGGVRNAGAPLWNPRRTTLRIAYWIARANNNFDGPFIVPPSGALATEWGPSPGDRRHRYQIALNSQALKNLNASFTLGGNTGTPYTITTGFDDNSDSIFNDRPLGIARNSARTATQATVTANLTYSVGFGAAAAPRAQERQGGSERGGAASPPGRYRLVLTLAVNNLANRPNFTGYSGIRTSPFYLEPTSVSNPRKIDVGVGLRF